jgi:hypothetical protein
MRKFTFRLLALFLLSGATTFAGSFTSEFSNPNQPGYTLNTLQDTNGLTYPLVTNSELLVLYNETNLGPVSIVLDDLDSGAAIDTFTASFQLQLGPGSSPPAGGIAFAFGPDINSSTAFNDDGPAMPSGGICVCFVTYWDGRDDGPGIGVNVRTFDDGSGGGGIVPGGYFPMANTSMVDGEMHPVSMQVKRNGTFNMTWNGQVLFTNLFLDSTNSTGYWVPTQGQFAIGAASETFEANFAPAGSEEVLLNHLSIKTTLAPATPVAPIITTNPQPVTVTEGFSPSFTVGFDGDAPFTFQWTENSVNIPDATNSTLTMMEVSYTNNGAEIACIVSNASGSKTSQSALLTVSPDTTPPTVTNAVSDVTFTNLTVYFNKPVNDTALTAVNYKVNQGVTVLSVARVNQSTVALATSPMVPASTYTLTINNVQDTAVTPVAIAANTQIQFPTFVFLSGTIVHKKYNNCSDNYFLANFFADPRYPNHPDRVDLETVFEYPPGGGDYPSAADPVPNYCDTLEGFFIPPATTNYVFFTCGDDEFYLYLSTDSSPANMYQICQDPDVGWTSDRYWETGQGTPPLDMAPLRSDENTNTAWPSGTNISLIAGKPYYMFAMHHMHATSGGNYFGVTYKEAGWPDPTNGVPPALIGDVIGYDFSPAGSSVTFTENPQSVTVVEGTWSWLSAPATGVSDYGTNLAYQWQIMPAGSATWSNVPSPTTVPLSPGPNFQTPILGLADSGMQIRAIASLAVASATSAVATVTVVPNTALVISAGAMMDPTNGVDIGVGFSATVDDAAGSTMANYSVSSGTIQSLTWCTNRFTTNSQNPYVMIRKQSALLRVTGFPNSGTVTVNNMVDVYGNKVASTNVPVTVATNMTWGNVGANVLGGWQAAVPVGPGDFDIYSDGIAEWSTYDETTFAYEQVTGDFDKKLRVEYQDGSSEWARAGIVVRDVLNFGVDAVKQSGSTNAAPPYDGKAGRYQKCHVNPDGPCLTIPGAPGGNAAWEGNGRMDTGGPCTTCLTNVDPEPLYPNPWCRITRTNQTFTILRSADGVNWEVLGTTTWGVTNAIMPATVYVGPEFSPENGNLNYASDQGTFLAQFRDYGDYVTSVPPFNPQLTTGFSAGKVTITWTTGTLVSSPTVKGTYTTVTNATSPYVVSPPTGPAMFYRVMQ